MPGSPLGFKTHTSHITGFNCWTKENVQISKLLEHFTGTPKMDQPSSLNRLITDIFCEYRPGIPRNIKVP